MKKIILFGLIATTSICSANAQTADSAQANSNIAVAPLVTEPSVEAATRVVRGGSQIRVQFLHEITTEDKASKVGDRPRLEVAENVVIDGVTVVPKGTPVVGELTAVRNKGMWGKSGKIEGRVLNMSLNGRTIRMSGAFDDKGVTGTAGVVAAVALVPVVGFFVTGSSARIPAGGQISAYVDEDIVFTVKPTSAPAPLEVAVPVTAPAAQPAPAAPVAPAPTQN
jgi:hypothetical protein